MEGKGFYINSSYIEVVYLMYSILKELLYT